MAESYKVLHKHLVDISNAIREKTGKTDMILFPEGFVSEISEIQTGGGEVEPPVPVDVVELKDVNFFDYDGTLVASYTQEEAEALTELPAMPIAHEGLRFQGWNYTLDEVKENSDAADVGAMYTTEDGATHLKIRISDELRKTLPINFKQWIERGSGGSLINWGDGTSERAEGSKNFALSHEYATVGDYVVKIKPDSNCWLYIGDDSHGLNNYEIKESSVSLMLKELNIGSNVEYIMSDALSYSLSLEKVSFPDKLTSIAERAFMRCNRLQAIVIPAECTIVSSDAFSRCESLEAVSIPPGTRFSSSFDYCRSLKRLVLPPGARYLGTSCFRDCYNLKKLVLRANEFELNNDALYECSNLSKIDAKNGVLDVKGAAFTYSGIEEFVLDKSSSPYNLGKVFSECSRLRKVEIGVFMTSVPFGMFLMSKALSRIIFNGDVKTISDSAFNSCSSLKKLDFTHCTAVPTISSNALSYTPDDLEILVPAALADEWKVATNWTVYADNIQGV